MLTYKDQEQICLQKLDKFLGFYFEAIEIISVANSTALPGITKSQLTKYMSSNDEAEYGV
jgi:hypothetical protein